MAIKKVKISGLPQIEDVENFEILGLDRTTMTTVRAKATRVRANTLGGLINVVPEVDKASEGTLFVKTATGWNCLTPIIDSDAISNLKVSLIPTWDTVAKRWIFVKGDVIGGSDNKQHEYVKLLSYDDYLAVEEKSDNTLYACLDEQKQAVTKAFIGKYPFLIGKPATEVYKITVGINPTDAADVKEVTAEGDVLSSEVSANKELYTFMVSSGGTITVKVLCNNNYRVRQLNVDTVSKGAIDSYKFENVKAEHTAYAWLEVIEEIPVNFLIRNDNLSVRYSSTHAILKSLKNDYPDGLTRDVTVLCIGPAKEPRLVQDPHKLANEMIFISVLKDWNKHSMFTLTIDGMNLLTYNCTSLGGLRFTNVDNVIIKNVKFVNFCNYVEYYSPDEMAAVMLVGKAEDYCRNFVVENCTFNGISTKDGKTGATYTVSTKYTENTTILNSTLQNNSGLTFKMSNSRITSFVRNSISGNYIEGKVSHAGIFDISGSHRLIIEDNLIDGTSFRENIMYLNNINDIRIRRNTFKKGARVVEFLANAKIDYVEIDSNLFEGMVERPLYDWIKEHLSSGTRIEELVIRNNTFWMSGNYYQKFVLRMTDVGKLFFYNNIVVDPRSDTTACIMQFTTLGECNSGSNLYKIKVTNEATGQTPDLLFSVLNPDNSPESITIGGMEQRNLSALQAKGYEIDTALVLKSKTLLNVENGGADYCITPEFDSVYQANNEYVPLYDNLYKRRVESESNSRGCVNIHGSTVNESVESGDGYTGYNVDEKSQLSHQEQHSTPADSVVLLTHNTVERSKVVIWRINGTQHNELLMGRYVILHPKAELNGDGEYLADELYSVSVI